jgi:hypothetical protein
MLKVFHQKNLGHNVNPDYRRTYFVTNHNAPSSKLTLKITKGNSAWARITTITLPKVEFFSSMLKVFHQKSLGRNVNPNYRRTYFVTNHIAPSSKPTLKITKGKSAWARSLR